jgi:hypothetical protein
MRTKIEHPRAPGKRAEAAGAAAYSGMEAGRPAV